MKVYLSSTLSDLLPERQAVKDALGGECIVVESYTADERSVRESCLSDVAECDLYIGIIGRRYGHIPQGDSLSITEQEFRRAEECALPTLIFIKDDHEIKGTFYDAVTNENPPELIVAFRQRIASRAAVFKTPEDLKAHVLKAYLHYSQRQTQPSPKRIVGDPYPGLRAFLTSEADRFFGRDAEIEALIERLLVRSERFLAVIGSSGSGKSSLVYAGLIPVLTTTAVSGGVRWFPVSFSPRRTSDDPFCQLADALDRAFPTQGWHVQELAGKLRNRPADMAVLAENALRTQGANAQLLLFADQFEELFAAKVDAATRSAFFALLQAAVRSPLVRVVIAMRSDFYNQWPQDEDSITLLRNGHFPLGIPGQAALEKMIVEPAKAAGLTIARHLVQRILDDTGTAPGALALAEFTLAQLYQQRRGNELTEDAYTAIGGVAGAIEGLAEKAVARAQEIIPLDDKVFSGLFLNIASVEQQSSDKNEALTVVRRRAAQHELSEPALLLAKYLVDQRILVSRQDSSDSPVIYEVGHEAVFSHWKRFQEWYARYANDLALRRQAEQAARDWSRQQRQSVLKWGWERQRPVIAALAKLNQMAVPACGPDFSDPMITLWQQLEMQLEEPLRQFLHPEPLALLEELNTDETPHQRREENGLRLNQFGDPRHGVGLDQHGLPDIAWIDIPAGEVTLETGDHFQMPRFRIACYPITWIQYRAFADAEDGYRNEAWWRDLQKEKKPGPLLWSFADYPVVNVSWYDAVVFCRWLSAKSKLDIRLPAEWEWQWAAVAATQQDYPWPGGEWNPARANQQEAGIGRTVAVGMYPLGRSHFGVDDMAGNSWEWCLNHYELLQDIAINIDGRARVLRGGCWGESPHFAHSLTRYRGYLPNYRSGSIGFRVLCESPSNSR
ncbi:SUMF1/EgtB/PvdO family nonheme iron enzyme [Nitrosomonas sp.]|uniref:nSTAND1 domain-containing NTPase n=1 Tax=Nitrosomonas sp. TaxID=42353 RepID=UPI00262990B2|nr:SUMF1/EgtB/PvdO family nonheme iron enzyme [Nitrosomonas sp.]